MIIYTGMTENDDNIVWSLMKVSIGTNCLAIRGKGLLPFLYEQDIQ